MIKSYQGQQGYLSLSSTLKGRLHLSSDLRSFQSFQLSRAYSFGSNVQSKNGFIISYLCSAVENMGGSLSE